MAPDGFAPPSDFVDEDDGGGMSAWKWLGIGCGVIVLIIGGLLAFGTWKSISCCQDMGKATEGSAKHAMQFAETLGDRDYQKARSLMGESLASSTTRQDLQEEVDTYRSFFETATPRIADQNVDQEGGGLGEDEMLFEIRVEYSPSDGEEKLVMFVDVLATKGADGHEFEIADFELEQRRRRLNSEPPAELVLQLHRSVNRGDYEAAFELMRDDLDDEKDFEAFKGFIEEHDEIFMAPEIDIGSVDYAGQNEARVRADAIEDDEVVASLDYLVESDQAGLPGWRITSIHPNYDTASQDGSDSETEADKANDEGDGPSKRDSAGEADEADREGEAEEEGDEGKDPSARGEDERAE